MNLENYSFFQSPRCLESVPVNRNIEIIGTDVRATTIHNLFQFEGEYSTKLDLTKTTPQVLELLNLEVLALDEVSMMDDACFGSICHVCSTIDHMRRPDVKRSDCFGPLHVLLFGDFKQLPPASARPPFPVHPAFRGFDVLCLRQTDVLSTTKHEEKNWKISTKF